MRDSGRTRKRAIGFVAASAGWLLCFIAGAASAAIAEGTAVISWSAAYTADDAVFQSYKVGEDLSDPALNQSIQFTNDPPSDLAPQSLNLSTATTSASVLANATTLTVHSESSNGDIGAEALMSAVFFFSGSGTLDISIPYTLSTSVQNNNGDATVAILASLEKFDGFNVSTGIDEPTPVVLFDNGFGAQGDATGMLSLQIPYNDAADFYAVLNLTVFSESSAVPVKTVPIPGGVALILPVLLPFFASRGKLRGFINKTKLNESKRRNV